MIAELEPPSVTALAEHLRDATWLDMRVIDIGTLERVRINQLNICRDKDEVVIEQQWWEEVLGDDEIRVETTDFTFNAEDVRWVRQTQVDICDVKPVELQANELPGMLVPMTYETQPLIDCIVRTTAFIHELAENTVRVKATQREPYKFTRARQIAMWLTYEMTNLRPTEIAMQHFGFKSQQAMLTASLHAQGDLTFRSELKRVAQVVEERLGVNGRTRQKPRRLKPMSPAPEWQTVL